MDRMEAKFWNLP